MHADSVCGLFRERALFRLSLPHEMVMGRDTHRSAVVFRGQFNVPAVVRSVQLPRLRHQEYRQRRPAVEGGGNPWRVRYRGEKAAAQRVGT
jgi:hypothetical protein